MCHRKWQLVGKLWTICCPVGDSARIQKGLAKGEHIQTSQWALPWDAFGPYCGRDVRGLGSGPQLSAKRTHFKNDGRFGGDLYRGISD